ncbi:MAG TPA: PSD1 and planctomycete cytochrome C domain-containing protein [Planctomycetota bacterium]|nr:PSD1 and planctomycete cytochrome C domain-containing protein [Planctomycetota bacterium]
MVILSSKGRAWKLAAACATLLTLSEASARPVDPAKEISARVDFNRDVRPILSDKCYTCHGPDEGERKAKLRLDGKEGMFAARTSGAPVVPGESAKSLVHARITARSPDDRMPPPESGKTLTDDQIDVIRRWINQGAEWSGHWSFIAPRRPPVPATDDVGDDVEPAQNPIDHFLRARLESAGLKPSPPADPVTFIRRVTLDITGLPPTPQEVDAFVADRSSGAREKLVDRLLSSPRYSEHMTRYWLDTVRYGDSHGLHFDNERSLWPYRDWVIRAFDQNKPFDAFTVEQLAGDLLPNPTLEQRIATGFNRCNVSTSEGGSIDEEVLVRYAVDRVEAAGTVWLGLTVGCAVCHDHKFDPISQKEFYQLFAFFNSFEENAMDGNAILPPPFVKVPAPEQVVQIASLEKETQALRERLDGPLPEVDEAEEKWALALAERLKGTWRVLEPAQAASTNGATLRKLDDGSVLAEGPSPDKDVYDVTAPAPREPITAIRLEALRHESQPGAGAGRADNSNFVLSEVEISVTFPAVAGAGQRPAQAVAFLSAQADYSQKDFDISKAIDGKSDTGWAIDGPTRKEDRTAVFFPAQPILVEEGALLRLRLLQEHGARHTIGRFRVSVSSDPALAPAVLSPWSAVGPFTAANGGEAFEKDFGPEANLDLAAAYQDGKLKWKERANLADGQVHAFGQEVGATYLYRTIRSPGERKMTVSLGSDDGLKLWLNGKLVLEKNISRAAAPGQEQAVLHLAAGENRLLLKIVNLGGPSGFYFKPTGDEAPSEVLHLGPVLAVLPDRRSEADRKRLRDHYRGNYSNEWRSLQARAVELEKKTQEIEAQVPGTMVTKEMEKRRDAFILRRGEYTQKGEKVSPGVPAVLPPLGEGDPTNRLGFARWLVRRDHPLTARVTVNRFWQQYFGVGIVKTAVDFGSQGEWPVHPELLDWLAVDFIESGWDVKRLQKLIVTSAAYRQTTLVTPEALEKDPENRLLSRGPRFRMDAEMIRDSALAIGGRLVERVGGPSVKPYQPSGIWEAVGFLGSNTAIYKADQGDALYRRGLYTFWKRTAPPPALSLFDAPSRETCTALRPRTNTPLQALAMMNDVQFFEASRHLAERMMREGGAEPEDRLAHAFRLATSRRPRADELEVLLETFNAHLAEFEADAGAALQAVSVGDSKRDESLDVKALAAYTMAANLILNLDETLTKG